MKSILAEKKTVAIIFGGCSSEYSVSLESSSAVIKSIDTAKYEPVLIGITQSGDWYHYTGPAQNIADDTWHKADCTPAMISPNRTEKCLVVMGEKIEKIRLDAAFPVLHGKNGEDGTVQGVLELAGIPVVGCGILASALCMDKDRAHKLAGVAGVDIPRSVTFKQHDDENGMLTAGETLGYPLFVKPVKAGSSYGITKVASSGELIPAVKLAFEHDDTVIIEENIDGFEVGCAVFGTDEPITGEVDEIELSDGFFDFTEKYTLKTSAIHVPARISAEKAEEVKKTAKIIYKALGCNIFARVDMFLTPDGRIVFNEVNTIPGFTSHSRFPGMLKAVGISFEQIISDAIEMAVK